MKPKRKKKRAPADLTTRNARHYNKEIWPLRQEVAKLKAENEQLKTCLLQMQNAAIDLTKQLAQAERAAWDAAQDAVTLEDNFGGEAHIKYGKFEDWKKEHHEKEADKEA